MGRIAPSLAIPMVAAAIGLPFTVASPADAASHVTTYVSPTGAAAQSGTSCATAKYHSLQLAVNETVHGGTVVVCPGVYYQNVTLEKDVNLAGVPGAVIDAYGDQYGVGVAASGVTVSGLTVENANSTAMGAPDDGILTAGFTARGPVPADHVTIIDDLTIHNGGAGIDLNSTSYSVAADDESSDNGIGINVADDLGRPAAHNLIESNTASGNPGGCGIVLAEHSGAGIYDNTVTANVADNNGLGTPSAPDASSGSGLILAAAGGTGGVYDNTVSGNSFSGNGHGGVTLHAHVAGADFRGNVISENYIGKNNLRTDFADLKSTGIYLGDVSPLKITIIDNVIANNYYGVFAAGSIDIVDSSDNLFLSDVKQIGTVAVYGG